MSEIMGPGCSIGKFWGDSIKFPTFACPVIFLSEITNISCEK